MTLQEFYDEGKYTDFVLIDGNVFVLPQGFKLSRNPAEKVNLVTMANGRKRKDIMRRWNKYSFAYEILLETDFQKLMTIVEKAADASSITLYLKKQHPLPEEPYEKADIDIIQPPKTSYKNRGQIYIHNSVNFEME
ncbi:hypothetical protein [Breznakiella homolactica]|uniref:Uncharacterized protein n=1 Tax=Breznakiella homolactica TaxID=2798577 RepID=A0A7T7XPF3_9SPIR|nr:hypothetical protein [Breznakiella homolactica]QQO10096.1 hypothetical protein JFL75_04035 [Breznakiella homolactica]